MQSDFQDLILRLNQAELSVDSALGWLEQIVKKSIKHASEVPELEQFTIRWETLYTTFDEERIIECKGVHKSLAVLGGSGTSPCAFEFTLKLTPDIDRAILKARMSPSPQEVMAICHLLEGFMTILATNSLMVEDSRSQPDSLLEASKMASELGSILSVVLLLFTISLTALKKQHIGPPIALQSFIGQLPATLEMTLQSSEDQEEHLTLGLVKSKNLVFGGLRKIIDKSALPKTLAQEFSTQAPDLSDLSAPEVVQTIEELLVTITNDYFNP